MSPKPIYGPWSGNFFADLIPKVRQESGTHFFWLTLQLPMFARDFQLFLQFMLCELWQISLELSSCRVVSLCQDCGLDIYQLVTEIVALLEKRTDKQSPLIFHCTRCFLPLLFRGSDFSTSDKLISPERWTQWILLCYLISIVHNYCMASRIMLNVQDYCWHWYEGHGIFWALICCIDSLLKFSSILKALKPGVQSK
jgi:hypothetical protein